MEPLGYRGTFVGKIIYHVHGEIKDIYQYMHQMFEHYATFMDLNCCQFIIKHTRHEVSGQLMLIVFQKAFDLISWNFICKSLIFLDSEII